MANSADPDQWSLISVYIVCIKYRNFYDRIIIINRHPSVGNRLVQRMCVCMCVCVGGLRGVGGGEYKYGMFKKHPFNLHIYNKI